MQPSYDKAKQYHWNAYIYNKCSPSNWRCQWKTLKTKRI